MKVIWSDEELVEIWTLSFDDYKHLENKTAVNKLGFSLTLKYLQFNGEFPDDINKFSPAVVAFVSDELDIPPSKIEEYMFTGRTHERHRREIRSYTGYRPYSKRNDNNFITWLTSEIIPHDPYSDWHKVADFLLLLKNLQQSKIVCDVDNEDKLILVFLLENPLLLLLLFCLE